jgi:hypothetical protein
LTFELLLLALVDLLVGILGGDDDDDDDADI